MVGYVASVSVTEAHFFSLPDEATVSMMSSLNWSTQRLHQVMSYGAVVAEGQPTRDFSECELMKVVVVEWRARGGVEPAGVRLGSVLSRWQAPGIL